MDIFEAAKKGDIEFIKNYKGDLNAVDNLFKTTALMYAVDKDQIGAVNALILAGANVNIVAKNTTALGRAVFNRKTMIVKALIAAGADVNAVDQYGKTDFMYAVESCPIDLVNALIGAGTNVNAVAKNGRVPLIWAIKRGDIDIVNALIAAGADINAVNTEGDTLLSIAAEFGKTEVLKALVAAGAKKKNGETLLSILEQNNQEPVYEQLFSQKEKWIGWDYDRLTNKFGLPVTGGGDLDDGWVGFKVGSCIVSVHMVNKKTYSVEVFNNLQDGCICKEYSEENHE